MRKRSAYKHLHPEIDPKQTPLLVAVQGETAHNKVAYVIVPTEELYRRYHGDFEEKIYQVATRPWRVRAYFLVNYVAGKPANYMARPTPPQLFLRLEKKETLSREKKTD